MKRYMHATIAAVAVALTGSAMAEVGADEAKQLGDTLTAWGAIKAGNNDGTIPPYTGPAKPPAKFNAQTPWYRPDPFADEKPLVSITAQNVAQHADKLSDGVKEMLKKYPAYRLDVYPSHRTASYPDYVLENARKNALQCKTVKDGLQLDGCYAGWPFPIPKTGNEVMWNRLLKFDQFAFMSKEMTGNFVDTQGNITKTGGGAMWIQYPIFDPKKTTPIGRDDLYEEIRIDYDTPALKDGEKLVVHDSMNMVDIGRRAWSYLPGQRRVKLAPDLSYDTPSPTGGGAGTVDEAAIFYGALDRYNFKLIGRKELYIPYNTYKIHDPNVCPTQVAMKTKNFLNPDCLRWELHRVWVVEATLKPGKRHIYPRRVLYFDEDLPGVGVADNYDSSGKIFRMDESLPMSMYEATGNITDEWVTYDLTTGAYVRQEDPTEGGGFVPVAPKPATFFSSEALTASGIR